jgi:hypothetical protein
MNGIIPKFRGYSLSMCHTEMRKAEEVANIHTLSEGLHPSAQGIAIYGVAEQPASQPDLWH